MRTNAQIRWGLLGLGWLVAAALLGARPQPAQAQTEDPLLYACYVPDVGAVYRVGTDSTPDDCFETTHVKFSWNPMDLGCTTGEVAKWTGTGWACGTDDVGAPLNHTHHGSDLVNGSVTNAELAADVSARVRGWHREQVEDKEVSPRSFAEAFAQCPAGQRVLGGGVKTKYDFFGVVHVIYSYPGDESDLWGWHARVYNPNDATIYLSVYAICAETEEP